MTAPKVGIRCTAVPDGVVVQSGSNKTSMRLSLVLTPDVSDDAPGAIADLSKWPDAVAGLVQSSNLRIYLGGTKSTGDFKKVVVPAFSSTDPAIANRPQAQAQWSSIFSRPSDAFALLAKALREGVPSSPDTSAYGVATQKGDIPPARAVLEAFESVNDGLVRINDRYSVPLAGVNWVQTRYLEEALNAFHDDLLFLRMCGLIAAQRSRGAVSDSIALVEVYQEKAKSILGAEAVDWVNSITRSFAERPFRHGILGSLHDGALRHLLEAGLGAPAGDAFGLLQRLAPSPSNRDSVSLKDDRRSAIDDTLRRLFKIKQVSREGGDLKNFVQAPGVGRDMMRAMFRESARQHLGGANVRPKGLEFEPYKVQAAKNFEAFHQHWRNSPTGTRIDHATQLEDAARRKFFGIRALPALAKFVRLIVDVELKLDDVKDCDWVAAMFVASPTDNDSYGSPGHAPDMTAFETDGETYFRPASWTSHRLGNPVSDLVTAPTIKNGVVDLRMGGGTPRFAISILDLPSAVNALRLKAEQDSGAQRDGTLLDSISTKVPERQARGLQLIDNGASEEITGSLLRFRYLASAPATNASSLPRASFAEDLVIGYRPYVQRWRGGGDTQTPDAWRSLVARQVVIADIAPYVGNSFYQSVRTRDHGFIRPAHKMQQGTGGPPASSSSTAVASPTTDGQVFAWMGASLALSTDLSTYVDSQHPNPPGQNPDSDLSLDTVYRFSENRPDDLLAALRVGDGYLLGLSPVYPNCGGPTLSEARNAFKSSNVTLGDNSGNTVVPFIFGPPRDIPSPGILVSEAEAKAWQKSETAKGSDRGNAEHVERIVLRSAASAQNDKDNIKRYLIPPRASFEVAEQSGMFDNVYEATPSGAFNDYEQHHIYGGFTGGDPDRPANENVNSPVIKDSNQQSRSSVLKPISQLRPPQARYYPDPLARNLRVAFERNGATPPGFPDDVPLHAFWKLGTSPIHAKPIELLVKRWKDGREGGQVDFGDTAGSIVSATSGTTRVLDRLAIEIAPAEEVTLHFWCVADRPALLRAHRAIRQQIHQVVSALTKRNLAFQGVDKNTLDKCISLLARGVAPQEAEQFVKERGTEFKELLSVIDSSFEAVVSALTMQTPDNGLNAWLTLKVVHAVEQPLAVPAIACRPSHPGQFALHPVRISRTTTWDKFVSVYGLQSSDPMKALDLPSEENGSTTYFVGQIEFDRASTGEVRIEASWPVTDPASAIQEVKPSPKATGVDAVKKYKRNLLEKDQLLFSIKTPRDAGANPEGRLDLTFDETGALRGLNFPFDDTAAREISLRIVATSRFTSDFPALPLPSTPTDQYALGRFEVESRPPMGSKRLQEAPQEKYRSFKVIIPASTAPTAVTVSRLEWVMPERLTDFERGRRVCVEKNFYPRLYLGKDWCRFEELVAVICAPDDLVAERPYSRESAPPPVLDPIPLAGAEILSAMSHRNIAASEFSAGNPTALPPIPDGRYFSIADSVCRWGADPTTRSGSLTGTITRERFSGFVATTPHFKLSEGRPEKVSLLLYKPVFDESNGEFYVDIGIDPGPAHSPVVQLVIARYQPHVIDKKFHLSTLTRVRPFQIAPKRKVEVLVRNDSEVTAIVQGVGYTDRNMEVPSSLPANANGVLPDKYRYPLQNVRIVSLNDSPTGLQVHDRKGQPLSVHHVAPQFYHPEMIWISEFTLPLPRTAQHYGLQVDEVDLHFADRAYEVGTEFGDDVIERLGSFSLTVDLERGLYSPAT